MEERDGAFGAAADPALLARLDLKPGANIKVGQATIAIRSALVSEPDKIAGGIGFGPRLLISEAALRATGLLQPGSLVRWHYRLQLPDRAATEADVSSVVAAAAAEFPQAGWEVRTRTKASPSLEQDVERFTQYLTLVGLTALLVGGVGVANAVKDHLERKRTVIATLKSLGATGTRVFADLSGPGDRARLHRGAAGAGRWGRPAVSDRLGIWRRAAAADRARPASGRSRARASLRPAHRARLRALAARRAHDVTVSALFRDEVTPAPPLAAPAAIWSRRCWSPRPLATCAVKLAYDQRIARISCSRRVRCS